MIDEFKDKRMILRKLNWITNVIKLFDCEVSVQMCVELLRKLISNGNEIEIYDYMCLSRYLIFTCLFIKIIIAFVAIFIVYYTIHIYIL